MKIWNVQGGEVQVQNLPLENLKSGRPQNPAGKARKTGSQNRTVRECALALLEFRDRTERELRQKLKEREYSAGEIEETVLFLKEYRYLLIARHKKEIEENRYATTEQKEVEKNIRGV